MEMAQFNQQFGQGNQMVGHLNMSWLLDRYIGWSPILRARADWHPSLIDHPWDQTTILLQPDHSLTRWADRLASRLGNFGVSTAKDAGADDMLTNKQWLTTQGPYFNSSAYWPRLSFDWYAPDLQRRLRQVPPEPEFQDSWATETEYGAAEMSLPRSSPVVVPATPDRPSDGNDARAAALPESLHRSPALLSPSMGILRPLVTSTLGLGNGGERHSMARGLSAPPLIHPVGQMRLLPSPEDAMDPSRRPVDASSDVGMAYDSVDLPVLSPTERQGASIALSKQFGFTVNDLETPLPSAPKLAPAATEISTSVSPAAEMVQNQFSGNQAFAPRLPLPLGPSANDLVRPSISRASGLGETLPSAEKTSEKSETQMGLIEQMWTNVGVQSASSDEPLSSGFTPILVQKSGTADLRASSLQEPLALPVAADGRQRGLSDRADDSAVSPGDAVVETSLTRVLYPEQAALKDALVTSLLAGGDFRTMAGSKSGDMPVLSMGLPELSMLRRSQLTTGMPLSQRMWLPVRRQMPRSGDQEDFGDDSAWIGTPNDAESTLPDEGRGEGQFSPAPEASFLTQHRFQPAARYLRDAGETGVPAEADEYTGFGEEDGGPDSAFTARLGAPPERIPLPLATVFPRATVGGRGTEHSGILSGGDSGGVYEGAGPFSGNADAGTFSWSLPALSFSQSEASGSPPTIARAAIDRPSGEGAASGASGDSGTGRAVESAQAPNLDDITQAVYALLKQRLSLERERTWGRSS